jgi:hypothetical protein
MMNTRVSSLARQTHPTHAFFRTTAPGRKKSYFGIFASYIDDDYQYKEVLMSLIHMRGRHTGDRLGHGLFKLLHDHFGIIKNVGPGTGDNASNNKAAATRLSLLMRTELDIEARGYEMVGCVCHIANIAALKYIEGECTSTWLVYTSGHGCLRS